MNYIIITKADGTTKAIYVASTVQPKEKLTYNQLIQYHRAESEKAKLFQRINN